MTEASRVASRVRRLRRNRRLLTGAAVLSAVLLVTGLAVSVVRGGPRPVAADAGPVFRPSPVTARTVGTPAQRAVALPRPITLASGGFLSWAMLDRRTGQITGSANLTAPSDTMSMIKAWLAADYLRRAEENGQTPPAKRLQRLSAMIRDSDNAAGEEFYRLLGGAASIDRLVRICQLTESGGYLNRWSNTIVSARDTVRLGGCIADGRAAGQRWTPWLIGEMRGVHGDGDFGIRDALADEVAANVAIKNGWLLREEDGLWHISCLAIGDGWVVGVLARYPGNLGLAYGAWLCRDVGEQLVAN
ncbi:MAG TPA: hypothetical protein VGJ53_12325 [Micromonosporaceae bacterium]